jgi:GDP-D-mannose dehydratase
MYHLHPYSIAKIMGHSMVDFYRKTYDLPFSNGILFTIESHLKRDEFLLNKVAKHAKQWDPINRNSPLIVGPLDSYRTILHASDAARAIKTIIDCNKGDSYLICNDITSENMKVEDLVVKIYKQVGISLDKKESDNDTILLVQHVNGIEIPVIVINNNSKGFDTTATNIVGDCNKLYNLGWHPTLKVDDIIHDLINNK